MQNKLSSAGGCTPGREDPEASIERAHVAVPDVIDRAVITLDMHPLTAEEIENEVYNN